jgi:alginate O-acetyltransferase complex protein AlgI
MRFFFLFSSAFLTLAYFDFNSMLLLLVISGITIWVLRQSVLEGKIALFLIFLITLLFLIYKYLSGPIDMVKIGDQTVLIGFSYYTLRCVHVILEKYKGRLTQIKNLDLLCYFFFLPTMLVGPIHRINEFKRDIRRHRWNSDLFFEGILRIIFGFIKIVLLGNMAIQYFEINAIAILNENHLKHASLFIYVEMMSIGAGLYLIFSGYSDIAIGFARLLGFRVLENFNWPFLSKNISEFWTAWHISLTSWARDYVYQGVVAQSRSRFLASFVTMLIIAFWHEVSIRYLIWGAYHAVGIAIWQNFQTIKRNYMPLNFLLPTKLLDAVSIFLTIHFVCFGFLLVRQNTVNEMLNVAKVLLFI